MPRPAFLLAVTTGLAAALLATLATLLVAGGLKAHCLEEWAPGHQPRSCYNDIQALWYKRDMGAHVAPYQGTVVTRVDRNGIKGVKLGAGQIEYPVLTGLFAWVTARPVAGASAYLIVSAFALAPFALLTTAALYPLAGRRTLLFALSPQLAAYAFLNWDLLPVAATAGALWAWSRRRYGLTGLMAGLGAAAKIWPGFLLLPFVAHLVLRRRYRDALALVGASAVSFAVLNLPFLIVNPRGWSGPYLAQSLHINDDTTNSIWYWLFDAGQIDRANLFSGLAVALAWAGSLAYGYRRRHEPGGFPAIPVAAAMVAAYIVLGRVDSPQYGLWLVPFLVVLAVPAWWTLLFVITDLWLWLQWSWLYGTPHWATDAAMAARSLVVFALIGVFLRSPVLRRPIGRDDPARPEPPTPPEPTTPPEAVPSPGPAPVAAGVPG